MWKPGCTDSDKTFNHAFIQHELNVYCVRDIVLGTEDTAVKVKGKIPGLVKLTFNGQDRAVSVCTGVKLSHQQHIHLQPTRRERGSGRQAASFDDVT